MLEKALFPEPEQAIARLTDPALAERASRLLAHLRAARGGVQQSTPSPKGEANPVHPSRQVSVTPLEAKERLVGPMTVARDLPPPRPDPALLARDLVANLLKAALREDPERQALQELADLFRREGLAGPLRLLGLLQLLARLYLRERHGPEAPRRASQALFHLPLDLVAAHLGVNRVTVWRWREVLEAAGLLRTWTHRAPLDGLPRASGTLWAVRLRPGRIRVDPGELRHPWRDLERDRAEKRTAFRVLYPGGRKGERRKPSLHLLLRWTLGHRVLPPEGEDLLALLASPRLEDLHLLPFLQGGARTALLEALADRTAALLADTHSRAFYVGLFWKVARGELSPSFLLGALKRTLEAARSGAVRRPGGLLVHLLRAEAPPGAARVCA